MFPVINIFMERNYNASAMPIYEECLAGFDCFNKALLIQYLTF